MNLNDAILAANDFTFGTFGLAVGSFTQLKI